MIGVIKFLVLGGSNGRCKSMVLFEWTTTSFLHCLGLVVTPEWPPVFLVRKKTGLWDFGTSLIEVFCFKKNKVGREDIWKSNSLTSNDMETQPLCPPKKMSPKPFHCFFATVLKWFLFRNASAMLSHRTPWGRSRKHRRCLEIPILVALLKGPMC